MSQLNFTTIFDSNYLSRGLSLYRSLKSCHDDFKLFVVALDDICYEYFKVNKYNNITVISLGEIEDNFPELLPLKQERSFVNYLFTLSPYYPLYVLQKNPELKHICSLDADQYFYSSPKQVFDALADYSVLITPHRFTPELLRTGIEKYGRFNVSFQVFRNNETGKSCLNFWREQCFNWCEDELSEGRFADQKYLDLWQDKFTNEVGEITQVGLGLAPWNINNFKISKISSQLRVGDEPLILFHYQGLRILEELFVYTAFDVYQAKMTGIIKQRIFEPIVKSILTIQGNKNDQISRNKKAFSVNEVKPNSKSSYFKILKGEMITFKRYLQLKSIKSGTLGRVKKFFGK